MNLKAVLPQLQTLPILLAVGTAIIFAAPQDRAKARHPAYLRAQSAGALQYTCTIGRFPDVRIGELFLSNHRTNSTADTSARDAAIIFSFAVQHGADPEVIRRALCRNGDGSAAGPLAAALDIIATDRRDSR